MNVHYTQLLPAFGLIVPLRRRLMTAVKETQERKNKPRATGFGWRRDKSTGNDVTLPCQNITKPQFGVPQERTPARCEEYLDFPSQRNALIVGLFGVQSLASRSPSNPTDTLRHEMHLDRQPTSLVSLSRPYGSQRVETSPDHPSSLGLSQLPARSRFFLAFTSFFSIYHSLDILSSETPNFARQFAPGIPSFGSPP